MKEELTRLREIENKTKYKIKRLRKSTKKHKSSKALKMMNKNVPRASNLKRDSTFMEKTKVSISASPQPPKSARNDFRYSVTLSHIDMK